MAFSFANSCSQVSNVFACPKGSSPDPYFYNIPGQGLLPFGF